MSNHFYIVTLYNLQLPLEEMEELKAMAIHNYEVQGVEEYSLEEAEVDAILGERSYSGGDLPDELIEEVDLLMKSTPQHLRFYFEESQEKEALGFYSYAKESILCEADFQKAEVQDWNAEWKKHYRPIEVHPALRIVPAWEKTAASSEKDLFINPGMGFGTGSHETTYLCLKLFMEELPAYKKILDFGSGSGILGLAALKRNKSALVDFYDIDIEANKNCYHNAEINEMENLSFRLLLPDHRELLTGPYELIFANILQPILHLECEYLKKLLLPHGKVILSGLLKHQVAETQKVYESMGFKTLKVELKGDWGALLMENNS